MVIIVETLEMLITFLCLGIVEGQLLHKSPAHFALFGNISSFEDLFLPEDVDGSEPDNITTEELQDLLDESIQIGNFEDYFKMDNINKSSVLRDERDFNDINQKIYKSTRKRLSAGIFHYFYNKDYDQYDRKENRSMAGQLEKRKILQDLSLQFLLHTRFKIKGAFEQRDKVRQDKRYKLGYLFNRLRRLKTEMNKILYQAKALENGTFKVAELRLLDGMLRDYERIVRIDVDIRDTSKMIHEEFNNFDPKIDMIDDPKAKAEAIERGLIPA